MSETFKLDSKTQNGPVSGRAKTSYGEIVERIAGSQKWKNLATGRTHDNWGSVLWNHSFGLTEVSVDPVKDAVEFYEQYDISVSLSDIYRKAPTVPAAKHLRALVEHARKND